MGVQIIKQPGSEDLYCLFDSIPEQITSFNLCRAEIIAIRVQKETEAITRQVNEVCDKLDNKESPYFQFTESWSDAVKTHLRRGGKIPKSISYIKEK